jgi:hypothetical protein
MITGPDGGPTADLGDDDGLVAALRRVAAAVDPVPDEVQAAARAAIGTRDLDRRLADLIADSADPVGDDPLDPAPAFDVVRTWVGDGPANSRLLSFASDDVQLDLEVSGRGDRLEVIGQFTGVSTDGCVLEFGDGDQLVLEVDSLGRFLVDEVRPGPVRARCRSAGGASVVTAWVTL